ncbi:hypothetical protein BDZ88DRAFT_410967 [Geranomyces variabilis]|nr:hypothetical protein BDZ88DRAFT_410967 [Geranomyces variabilis]KAJ3137954.1 hypothetical protein HDU90_001429 [Geranomyces variabilis]
MEDLPPTTESPASVLFDKADRGGTPVPVEYPKINVVYSDVAPGADELVADAWSSDDEPTISEVASDAANVARYLVGSATSSATSLFKTVARRVSRSFDLTPTTVTAPAPVITDRNSLVDVPATNASVAQPTIIIAAGPVEATTNELSSPQNARTGGDNTEATNNTSNILSVDTSHSSVQADVPLSPREAFSKAYAEASKASEIRVKHALKHGADLTIEYGTTAAVLTADALHATEEMAAYAARSTAHGVVTTAHKAAVVGQGIARVATTAVKAVAAVRPVRRNDEDSDSSDDDSEVNTQVAKHVEVAVNAMAPVMPQDQIQVVEHIEVVEDVTVPAMREDQMLVVEHVEVVKDAMSTSVPRDAEQTHVVEHVEVEVLEEATPTSVPRDAERMQVVEAIEVEAFEDAMPTSVPRDNVQVDELPWVYGKIYSESFPEANIAHVFAPEEIELSDIPAQVSTRELALSVEDVSGKTNIAHVLTPGEIELSDTPAQITTPELAISVEDVSGNANNAIEVVTPPPTPSGLGAHLGDDLPAPSTRPATPSRDASIRREAPAATTTAAAQSPIGREAPAATTAAQPVVTPSRAPRAAHAAFLKFAGKAERLFGKLLHAKRLIEKGEEKIAKSMKEKVAVKEHRRSREYEKHQRALWVEQRKAEVRRPSEEI